MEVPSRPPEVCLFSQATQPTAVVGWRAIRPQSVPRIGHLMWHRIRRPHAIPSVDLACELAVRSVRARRARLPAPSPRSRDSARAPADGPPYPVGGTARRLGDAPRDYRASLGA